MSPVQIPVTPPQEPATGEHNDSQHVHHGFSTRALHVGSEPELSASSAVVPGIELSTTYKQQRVGVNNKGNFEYTRSDNVSFFGCRLSRFGRRLN